MTIFRPRGWDCLPSTRALGGCAFAFLRASVIAMVFFASWTCGKDTQLASKPNVRVLQAACASREAASRARALVGVINFRRDGVGELTRQVRESTDAEARAWSQLTDIDCGSE